MVAAASGVRKERPFCRPRVGKAPCIVVGQYVPSDMRGLLGGVSMSLFVAGVWLSGGCMQS